MAMCIAKKEVPRIRQGMRQDEKLAEQEGEEQNGVLKPFVASILMIILQKTHL